MLRSLIAFDISCLRAAALHQTCSVVLIWINILQVFQVSDTCLVHQLVQLSNIEVYLLLNLIGPTC
jgi:hypothetical protein